MYFELYLADWRDSAESAALPMEIITPISQDKNVQVLNFSRVANSAV